jgi:protein TonB
LTDIALNPDLAESISPLPSVFPPVKPKWLWPVVTTTVVLAHVGVAAFLGLASVTPIPSLDAIYMEFVLEGDYVEQQEIAQAEDVPPEPIEEAELAMPPPQVMAPDATPLPVKHEEVEKAAVKHKREVAQAAKPRAAQQLRHAGAAGDHARTSGHQQLLCLAQLMSSMRRHSPASAGFGPGSAMVVFRVHPGGYVTVVSASGSTAAHAALARRIVSGSRGPSICGAELRGQPFNFH